MRGDDGSYDAYEALVPADVIGSVLKQQGATKALFIAAYKGYKRFADSIDLNKHLERNRFVIDPIEHHAEIFKRFGAIF